MHEFVSVLTNDYEQHLQLIVEYEKRDYDIQFIRPDVREAYTDGDIEAILHDLRASGLGTAWLEQLFDAGRLQCTMYALEERSVFHFARGDLHGVVVALDPDTTLSVEHFARTCRAAFVHSGEQR